MEENSTLLVNFMRVFLKDVNSQIHSVDQITFLIVEYFLDHEKYCIDSNGAVELVKLLRALLEFGSDEQRNQVRELCERFLKREWKNANGNRESGSSFNKNLDQLLQGYVDDVDFSSIENHVNILHKDFQHIITKKHEVLENFPSFNRSNALLMVRTYMLRTSFILKQMTNDKIIPTTEIEFWERCAKIFNHLMSVVKCIGHVNGFNIFLKNFSIYMRLFNVHGIIALKTIAPNNPIKFSNILKTMQVTTRFVHNITCDLKHRKNQAIFLLLPSIREVLMKFFQSVCALSNSIDLPPDAFFTGCLKNFDLNGEEILSQTQSRSDSDSDSESTANDDQSNVVEDDPDDDSENEMNDSGTSRRSARSRSTIF
jgi:Fanconi anemia group D2 protein